MQNENIAELLIAQFKYRIFEESYPRIQKCLAQLSDEEIWWKPNAQSNSVGNLLLHLEGNMRQWICAGLGKREDTRKRNSEFEEKGPLDRGVLMERLEILQKDVLAVLDGVRAEDLVAMHDVQVYEESGVSILVHVTEHFSYHVGQIAYYVKYRKDMDLVFYEEDLG